VLLSDPTLPPIYRLRPGQTTDSYGDPVESWDAPERVRLRNADVQGISSEETDIATREALAMQRRLFVRGKADLREGDRIERKGEIWRVDGKPVVRRTLATGYYTRATLTRFEGGQRG